MSSSRLAEKTVQSKGAKPTLEPLVDANADPAAFVALHQRCQAITAVVLSTASAYGRRRFPSRRLYAITDIWKMRDS